MKKILYLLLATPLLFSFTSREVSLSNSSGSNPSETSNSLSYSNSLSNSNKKADRFVLKENTVVHSGLYWSVKEVSNIEYKAFLMGLIEEGKADLVPQYAPDMSVWEKGISFVNPYTQFYFSHKAFDHYPVVGISHEAAQAFCNWKTRKFGERISEKGKKIDNRHFQFRLPTETEWTDAARCNAKNDAYISGGYAYPRDHKGRFLFNHRLGEGDYAGVANGDPKDYEGYMITAPVISFPKTPNGLYNVAGNVSEMVNEEGIAKGGSWRHLADECKIKSVQSYESPENWLGFRYVLEVKN